MMAMIRFERELKVASAAVMKNPKQCEHHDRWQAIEVAPKVSEGCTSPCLRGVDGHDNPVHAIALASAFSVGITTFKYLSSVQANVLRGCKRCSRCPRRDPESRRVRSRLGRGQLAQKGLGEHNE